MTGFEGLAGMFLALECAGLFKRCFATNPCQRGSFQCSSKGWAQPIAFSVSGSVDSNLLLIITAIFCLKSQIRLRVPSHASILWRDAAQCVDIGFLQVFEVFVKRLPRIPLRADEFACDAIALRAG